MISGIVTAGELECELECELESEDALEVMVALSAGEEVEHCFRGGTSRPKLAPGSQTHLKAGCA
jgi:hypothetical protein